MPLFYAFFTTRLNFNERFYCQSINVHPCENWMLYKYSKLKKYLPYSNICVYPTICNDTQFILSGNCSTCFGWYHHPSSRAQTTISTASGICHTVTAICRYRGRLGTVGGVEADSNNGVTNTRCCRYSCLRS
jgi:hypothetical protein